jgi:hypothetical protein
LFLTAAAGGAPDAAGGEVDQGGGAEDAVSLGQRHPGQLDRDLVGTDRLDAGLRDTEGIDPVLQHRDGVRLGLGDRDPVPGPGAAGRVGVHRVVRPLADGDGQLRAAHDVQPPVEGDVVAEHVRVEDVDHDGDDQDDEDRRHLPLGHPQPVHDGEV